VEETKFNMLEAIPVEAIEDKIAPVWEAGIAEYVELGLLETMLDESNETDTLPTCESEMRLEMLEATPVEPGVDETDALPDWGFDPDNAITLKLDATPVELKWAGKDPLASSEVNVDEDSATTRETTSVELM
jgi:hypothetical protein